MIDVPLRIMVFMWAASFSMFAGQYLIADAFGMELTNFYGEPIRSHLVNFIQTDDFNETTENIVTGNYEDGGEEYNRVETFTTAAAFVAWELIQLLSGTYIFNLLFLLGVPAIIVTGMVFLYVLLLSRAIIGYIRGV